MSRVLIIHDRFQFRGGAERLVLILAKALQADIMTEFWIEKDTFPKIEVPNKLFILDVGDAPWIVWRYFRAHFNFLFKTRSLIREYDTIIFSGNNCLTASFNCKKTTKKILYCHSPVRHVFDLWQLARGEQKKHWKKIIYYDIGAWFIRFVYWLGLKNMQIVLANSQNIAHRLKTFLHQKTDAIIYPPIQTTKFKWLSQGDYYLSNARVERLKRIPDIVSAFQKMPDKKLVVVSGGPDLEKVKNMAQGYENIKIVGWISDEEMANYLGNCIASIYIPINEDFGMTPLESMSAGKPCIGVFDGGLKETIIDRLTGKFIPEKYTLDDLIKAVAWLTPEVALKMRPDCEMQAEKFSEDKFIEKIKNTINL